MRILLNITLFLVTVIMKRIPVLWANLADGDTIEVDGGRIGLAGWEPLESKDGS